MEKWSIVIERVKTPLSFFWLALLVIEGILLVKSPDKEIFLVAMAFLFFLTLIVAILGVIRPEALSGARPIIPDKQLRPKKPNQEDLKSILLFSQSESPGFIEHFHDQLSSANSIILIGTGINILHSDPIIEKLMQRIKDHADFKAEIYAANPFSMAVEERLIEEEAGTPAPRIGKEGLIQWLQMMLKEQAELNNPRNLSIKLFSNYPTMALFIINKTDYYFYPYGYAHLGTLSPVVKYSNKKDEHSAFIDFFEGQYDRVKKASIDAQLVFDVREHKVSADKLVPFAVYFIPDATTDLYDFGTNILGYDLHENSIVEKGAFSDYVGEAANFGFHLTIADALYCIDPIEIQRIKNELEYVAKDFQPFIIKLTLQKSFPDPNSISLVCEDESGTLEALHFEMVYRCYRKAVASNYTMKLAKANRDRDEARAKLMIKHYKAPYIFQRFKPHFTLLTNVPFRMQDKIFQELKMCYEKSIKSSQIEIDNIALMLRPASQKLWRIEKKFKIGR